MAKKSTTRKTEPRTDAPAVSAPAKPRARARSAKKTVGDASPESSTLAPVAEPDTESVSMGSEPSEEDIRLRAYHRYLERGCGHGMDFDDWLQAKQDLMKK
jgi:hypothetical protein